MRKAEKFTGRHLKTMITEFSKPKYMNNNNQCMAIKHLGHQILHKKRGITINITFPTPYNEIKSQN